MSKIKQKGVSASFTYEPALGIQFLPGCGNCGGSHPLARKPRILNYEGCPDCGASIAGPGQEIQVPALIGGDSVWARVARGCFSIGEKLRKLAEGDH